MLINLNQYFAVDIAPTCITILHHAQFGICCKRGQFLPLGFKNGRNTQVIQINGSNQFASSREKRKDKKAALECC